MKGTATTDTHTRRLFKKSSPGMFIEQDPQTKSSLGSRWIQASPSEILCLYYSEEPACCIVQLRSQAINMVKNHSGKYVQITEFLKVES